MKHPRRTLRAALTAIAMLAAPACGDMMATDAAEPVQIAVGGTYTLVSIDQQALPYATSADGASTVRIASGQLVLDAAGSFQQVLVFSAPGSQWQSPTQGTYVVQGTRVIFHVSTGSTFDGTLYLDGRLEYIVQGNYGPLLFVYRRT